MSRHPELVLSREARRRGDELLCAVGGHWHHLWDMEGEGEEVDAWGGLSARYVHDDRAQFHVFVEQFATAATFLRSESLAKQRMALVAADNLAEVILARHIRSLYRLSEESTWRSQRHFDWRERGRLNSDFGARVELALWKEEHEIFAFQPYGPILEPVDAAIFRTAHAYRGRVYHADHHNEAILTLIGRAYLLAVGRSFVRSQPANIGTEMGLWRDLLEPYGYAPDPDSVLPGSFVPQEGARSVVTHLTQGLGVELADARPQLQRDLASRAAWADAMIMDLEGQGFSREHVEQSFGWTEFWNANGPDEKLVRLATDRDVARARAIQTIRVPDLFNDEETPGGEDDEGDDDWRHWNHQADAAQVAYNERFQELYAGFQSTLSVAEIERVRRAARRLSSAETLAALFDRYRRWDARMDVVERTLDEIAIGWDRHIQEEVDRMRGK